LLYGYRHLPIAEDLPGEAYLAFARLIRRFDAERGIPFPHFIAKMLPASLHTVVRRSCRIQARELSARATGDFYDAPDAADREFPAERGSVGSGRVSGDFTESIHLRDVLHQLLAQLPPRQAYVFVHRALQEEEYPQIASALGNSPGTVRVLYATARQRLQKSWSEICRDEE
jgi:RNA polymerase sigma factor (sigma-70 family)